MKPNLEAIKYKNNKLEILNQLLLPDSFVYEDCISVEQGWQSIHQMKVRGAPAIAITAALSLACELYHLEDKYSVTGLKKYIFDKLDYLCTSRPTAVNLFKMSDQMKSLIENVVNKDKEIDPKKLKQIFIENAENLLEKDISDNKAIGQFGSECFPLNKKIKILTHCNTGSLATSGYGTALGIIRSLHSNNKLEHAYATETRPYNQGARLTAFELVYENIPSTLITDSMVSFLMKEKGIDGVVVGADRVVANGDTANKIGTYQLAIAAAYHNVPFYVAAPITSIDCTKNNGSEIHIEERPKHELTHINGIQIAAKGIDVWNPSFDITPAKLITGIVTELGVIPKNLDGEFNIKEFLLKKQK
ncbi:S-methyl-5-thioribose-1-phosphate isomerase [Silvanigrella paludirubra]|uniref:Methylthioribose-1-phosphate isomerase n=1 Tax=Silvanigrella paludirubra TaxID=2499159 RepID=A0A6N6VTY3_9BACT|nr:S-methyl-5-thioribose-1-phosphate isomerase [Silvanigrella paludirubra]KAB8039790.1 S-methyl-5-thioribose-1-phosphate isomerase [Silvanigrella paludirubra]